MNFRDLSRNVMARDKALYGPRGGRGRRHLADASPRRRWT